MEKSNNIDLSGPDVPEIGPNDIVVHLVNPYKCGICEEEYLERPWFMKHMFLHLKGLKDENPTTQLTMTISLTSDSEKGFTITRDILQLTPDGSIKQVKKLPKNVKPNQVKPLQELEEAGVINLDLESQDNNLESIGKIDQHPLYHQPAVTSDELNGMIENYSHLQEKDEKLGVLQDSVKERNQSTLEMDSSTAALVANDDGTFRFSFNPLELEKQNIEIVPIASVDVENLVKNNFAKKSHHPKSKVFKKKTYECELCGKHLSCSTSLNRHKQYHKAEKPYVCEICNKGFKDNSNLKKHVLIHKREFACHMCKRSFLHKSLLEAHLRHHEHRSTFIKNGNSSEEVIVKTVVEANNTHVEIVSMKCLENTNPDSPHEISKNITLPQTSSMIMEKDVSFLKVEAKPGHVTRCGPALGDIARMYRCGHCGKETIQRGNIMRHLLHHIKKKPNEINQNVSVNSGAFDSEHVKAPVKKKLPHSAYIKNSIARKDKSFKKSNISIRKEAGKHKKSRPFIKETNLNKLESDNQSTASKWYICVMCQRKFKYLKLLEIHLKSHTVEEDIQADKQTEKEENDNVLCLIHEMQERNSDGAVVNNDFYKEASRHVLDSKDGDHVFLLETKNRYWKHSTMFSAKRHLAERATRLKRRPVNIVHSPQNAEGIEKITSLSYTSSPRKRKRKRPVQCVD